MSCVGTVRLGPDTGVAPVRTSPNATQADVHADHDNLQPQEAKIIESNDEYAIIEVVCSCGQKCHIQCNYADVMNA